MMSHIVRLSFLNDVPECGAWWIISWSNIRYSSSGSSAVGGGHHLLIPCHIGHMNPCCTQNGFHIVPNVFQSPGPVLVIDNGCNRGLLEVILPYMVAAVTTPESKVNFSHNRLAIHSLLMIQVKHTKFKVGVSPDRYNILSMRARGACSNSGGPAWRLGGSNA
jgi:hypothetical protein